MNKSKRKIDFDNRRRTLRFDGQGYGTVINLTPSNNANLQNFNKYVTSFYCVPTKKHLSVTLNSSTSEAHIAGRWPLAKGPAWSKLSFGNGGKRMYVTYKTEADMYRAFTILDATKKQAVKYTNYPAYSVSNVRGDEFVEQSSYQGQKTAVVYTVPYDKQKAEEHTQQTQTNLANQQAEQLTAESEAAEQAATTQALRSQIENDKLASTLNEAKTTKWAIYIGVGLAVVLLAVLIIKNLKKK